MTVTGTCTSIPEVVLFALLSTTNAWVIPALYPANPWILGAPLISGQESSLGVCDFALFLGPYALEPFVGRLVCGIFTHTCEGLFANLALIQTNAFMN